MQKYHDSVLNETGTPAAGVSVLVSLFNGGVATIYSDNGVTEASNPLTTNSLGYFEFYAADGRYTLTISGSGIETINITDVLLEDPQDGSAMVIDGGTISNSALSNVTIDGVAVAGSDIAKYSRLNDADGSSLVGFIQSGAGAVARTGQDKLRETVSVKDFGAVGDGVADDTAKIQAAVTYATANGCAVLFQPGTYLVSSTILIDESAATSDAEGKCSLTASPASVTLKGAAGNFVMLSLLGGTGGGLHSYQSIDNLRFEKTDNLGTAIAVDNAAYFGMSNVSITGFDFGIKLTDVLSARLDRVVSRFNKQGLRAEYMNASYPNAITLVSTTIANNTTYGLQVIGPTTLVMVGGSVEGNGSAAGNWGLKIDSAGYEGATGASLDGVYFEGNIGDADLWFDQAANKVSAIIKGCSFNRISGTNFTTNNIKAAVGGSAYLNLTVIGCGFRGFNSYVESAGRPYLNLPAVSATFRRVFAGNFYDATVAAPSTPEDLVADTVNAVGTISAGAVGAGTTSPSVKYDGQGFTTYRGSTYVTAAFAANNTAAPVVAGTLNGTSPFIGSAQQSDGTAKELLLLSNGNVQAGFYPSGTIIFGGALNAEDLRINVDGSISHRANATIVINANSHLALRSYTVATLPSASANAQSLIYVSDGTANKRVAVSDGTNWRWPDGVIVS